MFKFYFNMLFVFFISVGSVAHAESDACRSCMNDRGCERQNRECQSLCRSRLYTSTDDMQSCIESCTPRWASCIADAKSSCSFYCKDDD